MENLESLAQDYLKSAGFKVSSEESGCLVADKLGFGGERDTLLVWVAPPVTSFGKLPDGYEHKLTSNISSIRPKYPEDAKAFILASSREGFSRDLLQKLTRTRVNLRVSSQFFDTPFKSEESPKATSAIKDIRSRADSQKRIPQPFSLDADHGEIEQDIFVQLRKELERSEGPTVRIIVGRAGIGKSFLFDALFKKFYDDFQAAKKRHQIWPRPIPLLPEHLKGTHTLRTETLIDNFLRTDVASPIGRKTFEWLLVSGFATWMLDGLDELYAGDAEFFEYLLDLVTTPYSKAQITMWCRDSVLTTSDAFGNFQKICSNSDTLKIYRLSEWTRPLKKKFVLLKMRQSSQEIIEENIARDVDKFLSIIDSNPTLKSLSGLPFYCDLILKQFQNEESLNFSDDVELLNQVINQMVDREIKKGLLNMRSFQGDGLNEWLEQIAVDYIDGRCSGIDSEQAKEYGEIVLHPDLDDRSKQNTITSLLQFPLFQEGEETGRVAFTHDLIAETLAARTYLRILQTQPREVCDRLVHIDRENPMLLRFMARNLSDEAQQALINELRSMQIQGRGFAVALSLLLLANPRRDLITSSGVVLENRDLVAVRFEKRDLSNISFRCSDLSDASFVNCNLRDTHFEGAILNRTKFEKENNFTGAKIDLHRVQSIWIAQRYEEDPEKLRAWFSRVTGTTEHLEGACPTALKIDHLFLKYIYPNGTPRRDKHTYKALQAGKRFSGSAPVGDCIDAAVQHHYLQSPDDRKRYRRADGDKYTEMVAFVQENSVSDGIGRLIAELCPRHGCRHQLH